jgi:hypothetical protein
MNLEAMTIDELKELSKQVQTIVERKERENTTQAWKQVQEALINFLKISKRDIEIEIPEGQIYGFTFPADVERATRDIGSINFDQ